MTYREAIWNALSDAARERLMLSYIRRMRVRGPRFWTVSRAYWETSKVEWTRIYRQQANALS